MGIVVGVKAAFGPRVPRRGIQVGPIPAAISPAVESGVQVALWLIATEKLQLKKCRENVLN